MIITLNFSNVSAALLVYYISRPFWFDSFHDTLVTVDLFYFFTYPTFRLLE